jgi:hypothetical protein
MKEISYVQKAEKFFEIDMLLKDPRTLKLRWWA